MCGSETFEMLVSSSSMNVAIVTTSAIAHGLCARPLGGRLCSRNYPRCGYRSHTLGSTDIPGCSR